MKKSTKLEMDKTIDNEKANKKTLSHDSSINTFLPWIKLIWWKKKKNGQLYLITTIMGKGKL